jgi:hypothetical protein
MGTSGHDEDLHDDRDLVTVAVFTTGLEAHVARLHLESEGVLAFIVGEHLAAMHIFMSMVAGGVQLQVPRRQEHRARTILSALERGDYALDE